MGIKKPLSITPTLPGSLGEWELAGSYTPKIPSLSGISLLPSYFQGQEGSGTMTTGKGSTVKFEGLKEMRFNNNNENDCLSSTPAETGLNLGNQ